MEFQNTCNEMVAQFFLRHPVYCIDFRNVRPIRFVVGLALNIYDDDDDECETARLYTHETRPCLMLRAWNLLADWWWHSVWRTGSARRWWPCRGTDRDRCRGCRTPWACARTGRRTSCRPEHAQRRPLGFNRNRNRSRKNNLYTSLFARKAAETSEKSTRHTTTKNTKKNKKNTKKL